MYFVSNSSHFLSGENCVCDFFPRSTVLQGSLCREKLWYTPLQPGEVAVQVKIVETELVHSFFDAMWWEESTYLHGSSFSRKSITKSTRSEIQHKQRTGKDISQTLKLLWYQKRRKVWLKPHNQEQPMGHDDRNVMVLLKFLEQKMASDKTNHI